MRLLLPLFCMTRLCAFDATIPVVDLKDYRDPGKREQFLDVLGHAVKEIGFFAVVNTGIDEGVVDQGYSDIAEFFRLV